jgi:putative oxidoreductase
MLINRLKNIFLSIQPISTDVGLLIIRIASSTILLIYGVPKLINYNEWKHDFTDPLGLGSEFSLILCIMAEVFCSILVMLGLFTRIALVPLIINMLVIVLIVHAKDPFSDKEHGLSFLIPHILIFLAGPGRFSIDNWIFAKSINRRLLHKK